MTRGPEPGRDPRTEHDLPDALIRRLGAIDTELPPTPRWRPTASGNGQLHVVRGRIASRAASGIAGELPRRRRSLLEPLLAAALAVGFFGLGFLLSRQPEIPGRAVLPSAVAFVRSVPKIFPLEGGRTEEQAWPRYYTPELKRLVRERERLLFAMFPEFDT